MLDNMSLAFGDTFFLSAGIAVAGVLLSIILRKPKLRDDHEQEEDAPDPAMMMGH